MIQYSKINQYNTYHINKRNDKVSTRKWLELLNEYSKVAGYNTDVQKCVAFLYNNN